MLFNDTIRYNLDPFGSFTVRDGARSAHPRVFLVCLLGWLSVAQDAVMFDALDAVKMRERVGDLSMMVTEGGDNFRCAAVSRYGSVFAMRCAVWESASCCASPGRC